MRNACPACIDGLKSAASAALPEGIWGTMIKLAASAASAWDSQGNARTTAQHVDNRGQGATLQILGRRGVYASSRLEAKGCKSMQCALDEFGVCQSAKAWLCKQTNRDQSSDTQE